MVRLRLPFVILMATLFLFSLSNIAQAGNTLVSTTSSGALSNNASWESVVSGNGRYVVFSSRASNLVSGDTNGRVDVFRKDLNTGTIVNLTSGANGDSGNPSISFDGNMVAFESDASNLVTGDTNLATDIFVRNVSGGTIAIVSKNGTTQANGWSQSAAISANGNRVAFETIATNLLPAGQSDVTPFATDIYVYDIGAQTLSLVSAGANGQGNGGTGTSGSYTASLSYTGRYIVFESGSTNLVVGDTNGYNDIFVRDIEAKTTARVSLTYTSAQATGGHSRNPSISADSDGRTVTFESEATNLIASDTNGYSDVFTRDRNLSQTARINIGLGGAQPNAPAYDPEISADRVYVVFKSAASNLVSNDTNSRSDIFVFDRLKSTTTRISVKPDGSQTSYGSGEIAGYNQENIVSVSAQGEVFTYASAAPDIVSGDTNGTTDIFAYKPSASPSLTKTYLSIKLSTTRPSKYGASVTISGALRHSSSTGSALPSQTVELQTSSTGTSEWKTAKTGTTTAAGTISLSHVPSSKIYYRLRFGGKTTYAACVSSPTSAVLPKVYIRTPIAPTTMSKGKAYTIYGYLKPRHTAGTYPVRIYKYRKTSSGYKSYGYVKAKVSDYSSYSKYYAKFSLPATGTWRLRAYAPTDSKHAGTWSAGYDYVSVR